MKSRIIRENAVFINQLDTPFISPLGYFLFAWRGSCHTYTYCHSYEFVDVVGEKVYAEILGNLLGVMHPSMGQKYQKLFSAPAKGNVRAPNLPFNFFSDFYWAIFSNMSNKNTI